MIRAEIRFKNSAFIDALKSSGYESIAEFSRESKISYSYLIKYANLRHVFKDKEVKQRMIDLLCSDEWTLFEQYRDLLEKEGVINNKIVTDIPIDKIVSLSSAKVMQLESYEDIECDTELDSLRMDMNESLRSLKNRERVVIEMTYGLGKYSKSYSLQEIADKYSLSRERTRQILQKGLRRLKHRTRSDRLIKYVRIEKELTDEKGEIND